MVSQVARFRKHLRSTFGDITVKLAIIREESGFNQISDDIGFTG